MTPQRIQLRRNRGWRKPEGAIVVARPSKWGNPFKVDEQIARSNPLFPYLVTPMTHPAAARTIARMSSVGLVNARQAVECYQFWLYEQFDLMLASHELTGHDLACWCPLDQPCHADVLLELANPGWTP